MLESRSYAKRARKSIRMKTPLALRVPFFVLIKLPLFLPPLFPRFNFGIRTFDPPLVLSLSLSLSLFLSKTHPASCIFVLLPTFKSCF